MKKFFKRGNGESAADEITDDVDDVDVLDATDTEDEAQSDAPAGSIFSKLRKRTNKGSRQEDHLASVVGESEPGAAIELMAKNSKFVIGNNLGFLIMVLPTNNESFGGLNSRQKNDEDKGSILNLIYHDDIHVVVNQALLDDDALGIIPDKDTLERMRDFSILRDARYMMAVATTDVDTGALVVFSVPPKSLEDYNGQIFEDVCRVADGEESVYDSLVDENVVAFMLGISSMGETEGAKGEMYGTAGVFEAVEVNEALVNDMVADGTLPTANDFVVNLNEHFPQVYESDTGRHHKQSSDAVEDASVAAAIAAVDDEEKVDDADSTEVAGTESIPDDTPDDFADVTDFDDSDLDDDDDPLSAFEEDMSFFDDDAEEVDAIADEDSDDDADVTANAREGVVFEQGVIDERVLRNVMSEVSKSSGKMSDDQYAQLINDVTGVVQQTLNQAMVDQAVSGDDREFSDSDVRASATSAYVNDDLGVGIDMSLFEEMFEHKTFVVGLPSDIPRTPWLGDQADVLAENLNGALLRSDAEFKQELKQLYISLCKRALESVQQRASANDPSNYFGKVKRSIDADMRTLTTSSEELINVRRREIFEQQKERRKTFVEQAALRAGAEWDRNNQRENERAVQRAEKQIREDVEAQGEEWLNMLNQSRRSFAQEAYPVEETKIIEEIKSRFADYAAKREELYNSAVDKLDKFIADNRENDLHVANVTERKLNADTRVEELTRQWQADVDRVRADLTSENDKLRAEKRRINDNHEKEVAQLHGMIEDANKRAEDGIAVANRRADQAIKDVEAQSAAMKKQYQERIDNANEAALQAQNNADSFIKGRKNENWILIFMFIVAGLVMAVAGVMLGAVMF